VGGCALELGDITLSLALSFVHPPSASSHGLFLPRPLPSLVLEFSLDVLLAVFLLRSCQITSPSASEFSIVFFFMLPFFFN